jgi:hypothetical protein
MNQLACLEGVSTSQVSVADVDASFGLRTTCVVKRCIDVAYEASLTHLHSATLRKNSGLVSAAIYFGVEKSDFPIAVGQMLDIHYRVRFGIRSGPGQTASGGLLREFAFEVRAREGAGDLSRIRDVVRDEARIAARVRLVSADLRPNAPPGDRVIRELPPELAHFTVHEFGTAYPDAAEFLRPADNSMIVETGCESRWDDVWPLDSTDGNGVVFTGEYVSELERQYARCIARSNPGVDAPRTRRVEILFKRPFRNNEPYSAKVQLSVVTGTATAHVTIHSRLEPSSDSRPAIIGRVTGDRYRLSQS